ncbi:hypothetical protein [Candidatus Palauibacter sp.]|uniref:hypothetical protein n=1 Tax=Candidatus Palauibacter sp. TaxID=3101350 RepID=UPI003B01145F
MPVIDGFDELLGSGGYDEAFSSLAAFISRLEGNGGDRLRPLHFLRLQRLPPKCGYAHDGKLNYEVASVRTLDGAEADELVEKIGRSC